MKLIKHIGEYEDLLHFVSCLNKATFLDVFVRGDTDAEHAQVVVVAGLFHTSDLAVSYDHCLNSLS